MASWQFEHLSSKSFRPCNPPATPTGPAMTAPAAALPKLKPLSVILMFLELQLGHFEINPGYNSPQLGQDGAVLDTVCWQILQETILL